MRPIDTPITLDRARALTDEALQPIARTEEVALSEAHGRVLAGDIVSYADVPPFARSAMDGYAVRAEDTAGATRDAPRVLRIIEQVFTAQIPRLPVGAGECTAIATGAPIPHGADAVIMVEETNRDPDRPGAVRIFASVTPGQNIGRKGADIEQGQTVLTAGELLNASRVGAIAALGLTRVCVYARPRVTILSTGNEIVEPGQPLAPGHIYDVNRFTLSAIVTEHGGVAVPRRTVADTIDDLSRALDECLQDDIIVFSGGSSVGDRDLIMDVLVSRGEVRFHGIALKPGKPTAFGLVSGKPFFGMPGNPTSCLSNGYIMLVPAVRRVARLPLLHIRSITVPLAERITSAAGRHQIYTVRVVNGLAYPAFKASGDITSMSKADGYIEIGADETAVAKDTMVEVKLF